jgi:hypothetical protein
MQASRELEYLSWETGELEQHPGRAWALGTAVIAA